MKNTIQILVAAFAVIVVSACSTSQPVKVVKHDGKAYVPAGK